MFFFKLANGFKTLKSPKAELGCCLTDKAKLFDIIIVIVFQIELGIFLNMVWVVLFPHRHGKYGGAPHVWQ